MFFSPNSPPENSTQLIAPTGDQNPDNPPQITIATATLGGNQDPSGEADIFGINRGNFSRSSERFDKTVTKILTGHKKT